MRFTKSIQKGADVRIDYDAIEWDASAVPETFDRTGQHGTLSGRVETFVPDGRSVDAHFRVATGIGRFMVFANGDVFALPEGRGGDELCGIDASVTVEADRRVVA